MYRISFRNWLNSKNELHIRCKTQAEANFLCDKLIEAGKTWNDGKTYEATFWRVFKEFSCYSNKGTICSYVKGSYYNPFNIYEINEVDFINEITLAEWFD